MITFFKLLHDDELFKNFLFCIGLSILAILWKGPKIACLAIIWVLFYIVYYRPCKEKHKYDLDKLASNDL